MRDDVIIVGGGLAGVSFAWGLKQAGRSVRLLEASPRLGGKIATRRLDGMAHLELGPNSFAGKSQPIFDLIDGLGLHEDLVSAGPLAANRYILRAGQIVRLPSKPQEMLSTRALSWRGKLRFFSELIHVSQKEDPLESVHAFFTRHFGREVARYFADPFVSGIFAGDPRELVVSEAFPKMWAAQQQSASILRYLIREKKQGAVAPSSYTLKGGLGQLFLRAQTCLGPQVVSLDCRVENISRDSEGFVVRTHDQEYTCRRLCLAVPALQAAQLISPVSTALSLALKQVVYPEVVTAHVRVAKTEAYPFCGFGLLIPSSEKRNILGVLWNSSVFPKLFEDRDHHYLTIYCGGMCGRQVVTRDDASLRTTILDELVSLFSLRECPEFLGMCRHPHAIPQYTRDYSAAKHLILAEQDAVPGLSLIGNYLGGISMPDVVATSLSSARSF